MKNQKEALQELLRDEKIRAERVIASLRTAFYLLGLITNIFQSFFQKIPLSYEVLPLTGALIFSIAALLDVQFLFWRPRLRKYFRNWYYVGVISLDALIITLFAANLFHSMADPVYASIIAIPPAVVFIGIITIFAVLYLIVDIFRFSLFTSLYSGFIFTLLFFIFLLGNLHQSLTDRTILTGTVVFFALTILATFLGAFISWRMARVIYLGKQQEQLQRFLPQTVAANYMGRRAEPLPEGDKRRITILFADIIGFTSMSEQFTPSEIIDLLNEYFSYMINPVFGHNGTLDKFIGDGLMALFGAPIETGEDEDNALRCAMDMQEALKILNQLRTGRGEQPLKAGIGIHTGEVVIGSIGTERRTDYTAIGDAVNTASRLENLTRTYDTGIILSEETRSGLKNSYPLKSLGTAKVKGRIKEVAIYTPHY